MRKGSPRAAQIDTPAVVAVMLRDTNAQHGADAVRRVRGDGSIDHGSEYVERLPEDYSIGLRRKRNGGPRYVSNRHGSFSVRPALRLRPHGQRLKPDMQGCPATDAAGRFADCAQSDSVAMKTTIYSSARTMTTSAAFHARAAARGDQSGGATRPAHWSCVERHRLRRFDSWAASRTLQPVRHFLC